MHLKKIFLATIFSLLTVLIFANPPGGGDGGGETEDPGNDIPLDGGITLLLAAGAAYGAKKIYNRKKEME